MSDPTPTTSQPPLDPAGSSGQAGFTPLPDEGNAGANPPQSPLVKGGSNGVPLAATGVKTIAISHEDLEKFGISEEFTKTKPALVELILQTESMQDEERKYWFQLLPVMTDEQTTKLQGILQNERDQLAALDAKYEDEIKNLNEKHLLEWQEHEARDKRQQREALEIEAEAAEKAAEENVLGEIDKL